MLQVLIAFFIFFVYNVLGIRTWLSLVERLLWEQDAAGSNPVVRTRKTDKFRLVGFSTKSTLMGG